MTSAETSCRRLLVTLQRASRCPISVVLQVTPHVPAIHAEQSFVQSDAHERSGSVAPTEGTGVFDVGTDGTGVGAGTGTAVGCGVLGAGVGRDVGSGVGMNEIVGEGVGMGVGSDVGAGVVGVGVGAGTGTAVGAAVVGLGVGSPGETVGEGAGSVVD